MLIILRILFGCGLGYGFRQAWLNAQEAPQTGDLTNAFYLAFSVIMAIGNAVVWAPYLGDKLSDPLTGVMTRGIFVDRRNYLLRFVRWLDGHGRSRLVVFFAFLEGVHHPDQPAAFFIGFQNTKPGSWLEKVFASEVFRFDNAQHCMEAYGVLKQRGIDPRPHHNPQINMVLVSLEREVRPVPQSIAVPPAPEAAPLKRDRRIRLFPAAELERVMEARENLQARVETETPGQDVGHDEENAGLTEEKPVEAESQNAPEVRTFLHRIGAFIRHRS